jgi:predicted ArsR family transcriptional regulator
MGTLTDTEVKLLVLLSTHPKQTVFDLAAQLGIMKEKANYYVERLQGAKMIGRS